MIVIRIGTRTRIEGRLVGATNLDIGTYREADGTETTGITVTLSIPNTPAAVVGIRSAVQIGGNVFVVDDIVVADEVTKCEIHLRAANEG